MGRIHESELSATFAHPALAAHEQAKDRRVQERDPREIDDDHARIRMVVDDPVQALAQLWRVIRIQLALEREHHDRIRHARQRSPLQRPQTQPRRRAAIAVPTMTASTAATTTQNRDG